MSTPNLGLPTFDIQDNPDTRNLVNDKYTDTHNLANNWAGTVTDSLTDIKSILERMPWLSTEVIDEIRNLQIDTDLPFDPIALIQGVPEYPFNSSDWIIEIPDELTWTFHEEPYVSDLLTKITDRLKDIVVNGGGALLSVESQIFDHESERDALANEDAKTKAAANWSKRGFSKPGLGLFSSLTQIDIEYQNKQLDKSRKIAEESRKVEIQMEQEALKNGVDLEKITQGYWNDVNNRSLEAAKAVTQYGLAIVSAKLSILKARVEAYSTAVQAYGVYAQVIGDVVKVYLAVMDAKLRGALAKIEAELKLIGVQLDEYKLRYGGEIDALKTQAQVAAQIAASALAAVHVTVGMQETDNRSKQQSQSVSETYGTTKSIS